MTIESIEQRWAAATPGRIVDSADRTDGSDHLLVLGATPADAEAIAHAPTDVAALLAVAKAAKERRQHFDTRGEWDGDPEDAECDEIWAARNMELRNAEHAALDALEALA